MDDELPQTAPGFSQPLEMLKACHERIRSQCEALVALAGHLRSHGHDARAREAAGALLRYFDTAARHHHEDEEEDLLPRMMTAATLGRGSRLTRMVADLANEHRQMERAWTELRAVLQEISAGEKTPLDALDVDHFVKLYQAHIAVEEAAVFPLAELLLSREDLETIGAAMAARRGVKFP
ncbi:MAG TPA: hemerythrin domain-containing protein [Burkholderiales bacterium]|nr:hemerythrin domain-containing protein [Burkholderiales bacterium]